MKPIAKIFYKYLLKPILFLMHPDFVHERFTDLGEFIGNHKLLKKLLKFVYGYKGPNISKTVDGITYEIPVLLSAGFDYNGRLTKVLDAMSFGGVVVGSVTWRPCAGNPKPHLRRAKKSKSIIVYKGLKNDGTKVIANRLKNRKNKNLVVGVSIAKTNDRTSATTEEAIDDYFQSFRYLNEKNIGDFYTINISCPNTYGGEPFTTPQKLNHLMSELAKVKCNKPVYVKMPINLSWTLFDNLLQVLIKYDFIKGVTIGNLNKNYNDLDYRREAPVEYRGGLSGKPCFQLSNDLIKRTRSKYKQRFTIIGVGGILSADDAIAKFKAGADLVQLITGMIFTGPHLMSEIAEKYYTYISGQSIDKL